MDNGNGNGVHASKRQRIGGSVALQAAPSSSARLQRLERLKRWKAARKLKQQQEEQEEKRNENVSSRELPTQRKSMTMRLSLGSRRTSKNKIVKAKALSLFGSALSEEGGASSKASRRSIVLSSLVDLQREQAHKESSESSLQDISNLSGTAVSASASASAATTTTESDELEQFMGNLESSMSAAERAALKGETLEPSSLHEASNSVSRASYSSGATENGSRVDSRKDMLDESSSSDDDGSLSLVQGKRKRMTWLERQQMSMKAKELPPIDHSTIDYMPFRKMFYIEAPEIRNMSREQVAEYRRKDLEGVQIRGKRCPWPIKKWAHCGLPSKVYAILQRLKYDAPFAIQKQAIPVIMSGRDCIACAKTGSGKTLAFVLPMLRHIQDQPPIHPGEGPVAVIMAPTRELVNQIYHEVKRFARSLGIRSTPLVGGASVGDQINALKSGVEIVVVTPGRFIDVLSMNNGRISNLRRCTMVVLDEADRMFDMGFEPQIMKILAHVRPDRQIVMFSATFPRSIESLARKVLTKPVEIVIGGRSVASRDVTQFVEVRPADEKFSRLLEILGQWNSRGNILIFADSKEAVDELFRKLIEAGYSALALHGGLDQADRDFTISDFKKKVCNILVATSVVSRGLDVKDLVLVINYMSPNHYEDYVHRVGRTGRAGRKGTAITFIEPDQEKFAPDLVRALVASGQTVPDDLQKMANVALEHRKAGDKEYYGSRVRQSRGYKFNASERVGAQKVRRLLRLAYQADQGGKDDMDEDDIKQLEDERVKNAQQQQKRISRMQNQRAKSSKSSASSASDKKLNSKEGALRARISAMKRAAAASAAALATSSSSSSSLSSAEEARRVAQKITAETAKKILAANQRAAQKRLELLARKLSGGQQSDTTSHSTVKGEHSAEVEINDYPIKARLAVTRRGSLEDVLERAECAVSARGIYVAPGKRVPQGERKLYIHIQGMTSASVEEVQREIIRRLEEVALTSIPTQKRYGKYSVV